MWDMIVFFDFIIRSCDVMEFLFRKTYVVIFLMAAFLSFQPAVVLSNSSEASDVSVDNVVVESETDSLEKTGESEGIVSLTTEEQLSSSGEEMVASTAKTKETVSESSGSDSPDSVIGKGSEEESSVTQDNDTEPSSQAGENVKPLAVEKGLFPASGEVVVNDNDEKDDKKTVLKESSEKEATLDPVSNDRAPSMDSVTTHEKTGNTVPESISGSEKDGDDTVVIDEVEDSEDMEGEDSFKGFRDKYIQGRLRIGLRSTYRHFTDADSGHRGGFHGSGTYLGTIYALDEKQNLAPVYPYISWYFHDYVGLELTYDHLKAETVATNGYGTADKTDGDVELSGPTLSLLVRYQNKTDFTPWVGLGVFFYSGGFDADPAWAHSKKYTDAYNQMNVDNVSGLFFSLGADWKFHEHWLLNFSLQYMPVDVDAVYTGYLHGVRYTTQPGHFPVDNIAVRLGIGYQF